MGGLLDGGKDLGAGFGIELVPVEAQEQALADRLDRGVRILLLQGGFYKGLRGVAHGTSHDEPFFPGPLHEHSPIALVHFGRRIVQGRT